MRLNSGGAVQHRLENAMEGLHALSQLLPLLTNELIDELIVVISMVALCHSTVSAYHLLAREAVELQFLVMVLVADILVRARAGRESTGLPDLVKGEELVTTQVLVPLVHLEAKVAHGRLAAVAVGHGGSIQVLLTLATAKLPLRDHGGVDVEVLHQIDEVEVGEDALDAPGMSGHAATSRALHLIGVVLLDDDPTSDGLGTLETFLTKRMKAR